jgi:guanylate kinase
MKLNDEINKCVTLILSGASGTGKTTICRKLLEKLPNLKFTVSHTTRPRRSTDIGGRDYYFISEAEFEGMKIRGEFLEWATINDYSYGTSFDSVKKSQDNSEVLIIELDVQGVQALHKINFEGVYIFILPPSLKELEARLRNRKTETEEKIRQRLERGREEIKKCLTYDYILTNHGVEDSVDNIISIVNGCGENFESSKFIPESPDIKALLNYSEKD